MHCATSETSDPKNPITNPNQNTLAGTRSNRAGDSPKRYFGALDPSGIPASTLLVKRICSSPVPGQAADHSFSDREQLGGKGMFLMRMEKAGLSVPPFECVTAQVISMLEKHPLDRQLLVRYLPVNVDEPDALTSLTNIREYLNTLPPSEQSKKDDWLAGLAEFIASEDYYQQVKDSEAAQKIRDLRRQLDGCPTSQPIIIRSSGINEDNYGDAQAGKYLSVVQKEDDVLSTCLKVMASAYRPEVCPEGIPQPMALIIQQCIDCKYGGVAMSFRSFQDGTIRVEYTPGQPRGAVAGQSGNTPHRIDISRVEGADSIQYFPGTISSHFVLHKNNKGYSETAIQNADAQTDDGRHKLSDHLVTKLSQAVTELENLLLCPVDVEFAIDHQGNLFLLQVRPVTQLSGGMDFVMPIPEESLAIGESISEGYCTGPIWLANERQADTMPKGAIVVAQQAKDWMLESGFLKRAGGFVFAYAGFNDHVAILMRQLKVTFMRASGQYSALAAQVGEQATLACARFMGKPGAFIVAGNFTEKLASHSSLSSAFSDAPLKEVSLSRDELSPHRCQFRQVASCFHWLTDQNARLLAFFASDGRLGCLANPIKLSMSPARSQRLAEIRNDVNQLIRGAEVMLEGYQAFLRLAGKTDSPLVNSLRVEFPQLSRRFQALKRAIESKLESIISAIQTAEEGRLSPVIFRQWLVDCKELESCLQKLNPKEAEQVQSVHDLIFALHQRFVEALAPVTLGSGQGSISKRKDITYVDCTTPCERPPLLTPSAAAAMEQFNFTATVVSLNDALIVNLRLGNHMSVIELLEHAEGGKGRTLRLKFADTFGKEWDFAVGKLKRVWFMVQLLKEIVLDNNTDGLKTSINAVASEVIIECPRIRSPETLQNAFQKLIIVLRDIKDVDMNLDNKPIFEGDQWDFNLLEQRLDRDIATEADRFAFRRCLFSISYTYLHKVTLCYPLLSKQYQQFIDDVQRLSRCAIKSKDDLQALLMSDERSDNNRRELLQHFLFRNPEAAMPFFDIMYPQLKGQYYVVRPSFSERPAFYVPPGLPVGDHKEKIENAIRTHGLKYASQAIRNDRKFYTHYL
ncbi:PEP/pyruvate-binding domain-containing protein [Endozoicomonas sp. ALC020]|uniref:PEP/pyruvate-binding domain-containing protein n=1 Tax=unclassified Endozoicomonas TaxID=2644528 RepID=UPI003BB1F995